MNSRHNIYNIQMQFKIKAGRFVFEKDTKKVKADKTKGLIHIIHNRQQQQTHFKWANLETHVEELDIIVFPGDAVFEAVIDKNNTYVLRFGMDDERYFFWLQEKTDTQNVVKEINRIINLEQQQNMIDQKPASKAQPDQQPSKPVASTQAPKQPSVQPSPQVNPDFISKLVQGIAAANKNQKHHHPHREPETALIHLTQAVTPQSLSTCLKSLTPEQLQALAEFMPDEHKDKKYLSTTVHSPQFLQALDVLSDALNSENALPIFMEMGLSQTHLEKNYGVQAFLLALIDKFSSKHKKQQKQEQKNKEQMKDEKEQKKQ